MISSGNTKIVIYTVLVGNYDKLCQPKKINEGVDYVCFTDKEDCNDRIGVWRVVGVPFSHKDNGRVSRYPKILPHKTILSEYDYSLYIDANLIINDNYVYERIQDLIANGDILAMVKHPDRDCVYQEAYTCISGFKAKWRDVFRQILYYKMVGIPKHWGLYEANIIFRKHNDTSVVILDELWWKFFLKYSKRDQLSLVYALWKTGITVPLFLPEGFSATNHFSFERLIHLKNVQYKKTKVKMFFLSAVKGIAIKLLRN